MNRQGKCAIGCALALGLGAIAKAHRTPPAAEPEPAFRAAEPSRAGLPVRPHRPRHRPYRAPVSRMAMGTATPNAWSVPQWEIDGSNATGCASDANTCTSAVCAPGGVGPCATARQVASRLGPNPAPSIDVVFDFLSDTAAGDAFDVVFSGVGFPVIQGQLRTLAAGTIGTVDPRFRGSIAGTALTTGHPWRITAGGGAPSDFWTPLVGALVHDTTADAWAWVHSDLGSAEATWTEPLTEETPAFAEPDPPNYVTPTAGDAFVAYALPQVTMARMGGLGEASPVAYHVGFTAPDQFEEFGSVTAQGDNVILLETQTSNAMAWAATVSGFYETNCSDDAVFGGTLGATAWLLGGEVRDPASEILLTTYSALDGDVLVGPRIHVIQNGMLLLGRVCIENQLDADLTSPTLLYVTGQLSYGDAFVWTDAAGGPGALFLARGSRLFVQSNNVPFLDMTTHVLVELVIDNNAFLFPWNVRSSGAYAPGFGINGALGTGVVSARVDAVVHDAGVNGANGLCFQGDMLSALCYQ